MEFLKLAVEKQHVGELEHRNLYKKLEETSEIEGFDEYLSILKEIHQQFIDLGEIPPFSVQTPKEKIELDLEKSVIGQALKRKIETWKLVQETNKNKTSVNQIIA